MTTSRTTEILGGIRLLTQLPAFLRRPLDLETARSELQRRLESRSADFEHLVRTSVYGNESSPYLVLLRAADCELGDVQSLLQTEGVEGCLEALARNGIYLTIDEFKGRTPVRRGSTRLELRPEQLLPHDAGGYVTLRSGGSRSRGTRVPVNLAYVRDRAVSSRLAFAARGGDHWTHGVWSMWGRGAMVVLLELAAFGTPPAIWFSQVDPDHESMNALYRASTSALRAASLLAGQRPVKVSYVPLERAVELATWMAGVHRRGGTAHVHTHASSAVRVCEAADAAGLDIRGAHFTAASEPLTEARRRTIRGVGAQAWPQYSSVESGVIGLACSEPEQVDDVHFLQDRFALIQGGEVDGFLEQDLFFTCLRPTVAPFVLINVSLGDQAAVEQRDCGCPLGALGWNTHLHSIGSREKMTVAGMSLLDTEIVRVLEEALPQAFGGGPTDYQLVEETGEDDHVQLTLRVSPSVGDVSSDELAHHFLESIGAGSESQRISILLLREAGMVTVKRAGPLETDAGKILHIHRRVRS